MGTEVIAVHLFIPDLKGRLLPYRPSRVLRSNEGAPLVLSLTSGVPGGSLDEGILCGSTGAAPPGEKCQGLTWDVPLLSCSPSLLSSSRLCFETSSSLPPLVLQQEQAGHKRERVESDPGTETPRAEKKKPKASPQPEEPEAAPKPFTPFDYSKTDLQVFAGEAPVCPRELSRLDSGSTRALLM